MLAGAAAPPAAAPPAAAGVDLYLRAWRCNPVLNPIYERFQVGGRFVPNPLEPENELLYIPNSKHNGGSANIDADNAYQLVAVNIHNLTLRKVEINNKNWRIGTGATIVPYACNGNNGKETRLFVAGGVGCATGIHELCAGTTRLIQTPVMNGTILDPHNRMQLNDARSAMCVESTLAGRLPLSRRWKNLNSYCSFKFVK